jgi:leucyl aminopeptidase
MDYDYTNNIKKNNIQLYVITVCNNIDKVIKILNTNFNINNVPKSFLNSSDLFKRLYFESYEILFIFMKKKCNHKTLFETFGMLGKELFNYKQNALIILDQKDENVLKNQIESFLLGNYKTLDYKTNIEASKHKILFYHTIKYKKIIKDSIYIGSVQNEARFLSNTPANILDSEKYEKYIKKNITESVKVSVINESKLKKLGLNLILSVNEGSKHKARLIQLTYKRNTLKNDKPIVFIGKGVMFDSGGYNIKKGDFTDMKNDMTSSSIIYGLFKLLDFHKVNGYFIALLPIVENMINSKATRPGDIITSYSKKTVEITNTDAEGRLILADCLSYSEKFHPKLCVDLGTLAGINSRFLGNKACTILGNNNKIIKKIMNHGEKNNEYLLEIPMWEEYVSETKSDIADFKNDSGNNAGGIMPGAFLSNFIPKNTNWVHLDIASIDYLHSETKMRYKGATGNIIRTLFDFSKEKGLTNDL